MHIFNKYTVSVEYQNIIKDMKNLLYEYDRFIAEVDLSSINFIEENR
jgi:hypothetical protein